MRAHALLLLVLAAAPAPGATAANERTVNAGAPRATATAAGGAAASGAPRDDVRDQVLSYLGAIDRPVSAATWRALGPGAEPVLAEVAASPDEPPTRRARALEGLAALGGARAEEAHLRLAHAHDAPAIVRSSALRGLGRLLPPARLAGEVRPLLGDASPRVRVVAGEVLARGAPGEACADVRAQAARERAPARWSRALSACARGVPSATPPPRAR